MPVSGKFPVSLSLGMELYHCGWSHVVGSRAVSRGWGRATGGRAHITGDEATSLGVGPRHWRGGGHIIGVEPHQQGGATSLGWGHGTMNGTTSLGVESCHWGWSLITGGGAM